jgi:chemosensory pili system protein ChpA (sensor histidine kinase/response regulator)
MSHAQSWSEGAALGAGAAVEVDCAAEFGRLADQAGLEGCIGLQDACLLLVEVASAAEDPLDAAWPARLGAWTDLVEAYRREPLAAIAEITGFLRQQELGLPLSDEELGVLEAMLIDDAGNRAGAEQAESGGAGAAEPEAEPLAEQAGPEAALASLPKAARELVKLLLFQTDAIDASLRDIEFADPLSAAQGLEQARERLECFANAARTAGFGGLSRWCEQVGANIERFLAETPALNPERLALLRGWLREVARYLPNFQAEGAGGEAVARLEGVGWPLPLASEAGAAILEQMRGEAMKGWREEAPARPQTATADDVSLAVPGDVSRELLDILLQELPVHTRQFSEAVQRLGAGGDLADLQVAQRLAHTLKGSANTVGIGGVATLTHHLEDILSACAKEVRLPAPALVATLSNAADCLEAMAEALLGQGGSPVEARAVLQEVLDWANRIDRDGLPDADTPAPTGQGGAPAEPEEAEPPVAGPEPAQSSQSVSSSAARVPTERIGHLLRLSGESIILASQAQERLRRMKGQLQAMRAQFELLRQLGSELEELIDVRDWSGRAAGGPAQDFDALEMDQYNELHTASRRMVEAAVDAREMGLDAGKELEYLDEVLEYQQSLAIDTQEAVMETRLVAVAALEPRLQRSLRQTCRVAGKQVNLSLAGGGMLIDGDTLDALADPLMHALRNAVDHGIETPEERRALGKPERGQIAVSFDREGNAVVARCRDDGRGLDFSAIRAAAEQRGLIEAGQEASEEELRRFILRPNFSTRDRATQISGRGVGLDAVQAQVVALGGTLALDSQAGRGLAVELRVPLPLSRSHALLVHVGAYRVAIANKGLEQIFHSDAGQLRTLAHETMLLLEGAVYPAVSLRALLRVAEHRHQARPYGAILLVRGEAGLAAVLVDAIVDSREVVVKPLGHYIPRIPGMIGATILGDGAVTPVIDAAELLRSPARAGASVGGEAAGTDVVAESVVKGLPLALVVDDSLSQRRALEQLLADVGYQVRAAHDGLEAAELLAHVEPDIVLTDLEMPRMNGIELAAHIRARPERRKLPIVMITSRTTQRHRQLAESAGIDAYLTKPVRDDELLDLMRTLLEERA